MSLCPLVPGPLFLWSFNRSGRYVYENFGADTGEGYGYSSEAQPMYSWGALAGFVGLQANGFYGQVP